MTFKILLTSLFLLSLVKVKSQTSASDTITNWQIYLGENRILAENEVSVKYNGVKTISVKRADLEGNKYLIVAINTCVKTKDRNIEIQFGDGKNRYSQSYYKGDNLKIKTSFILELLSLHETKKITLSLKYPPHLQPNGVQNGLLLVDLNVDK